MTNFGQGSADRLPYADASFDRVFSSFMFHHLRSDQRAKALSETSRVLVPGGSLHLVDFERPDEANLLSRLMHSSRRLNDNSEHRILALLKQAGFASQKKVMIGTLLCGLVRTGYYEASVAKA